MKCDCEEFKKWDKIETGNLTFLYVHGIKYPNSGPFMKYCPFCGKPGLRTELETNSTEKNPVLPSKSDEKGQI